MERGRLRCPWVLGPHSQASWAVLHPSWRLWAHSPVTHAWQQACILTPSASRRVRPLPQPPGPPKRHKGVKAEAVTARRHTSLPEQLHSPSQPPRGPPFLAPHVPRHVLGSGTTCVCSPAQRTQCSSSLPASSV